METKPKAEVPASDTQGSAGNSAGLVKRGLELRLINRPL